MKGTGNEIAAGEQTERQDQHSSVAELFGQGSAQDRNDIDDGVNDGLQKSHGIFAETGPAVDQ